MRITTRMMTTRYSRSLNNLSSGLDNLNNQIASGRKFSKASENTSAAITAFQLRRDISKIEGYQSNIAHAQDYMANAESTLMSVNEMMQSSGQDILQGKTGTVSASDRAIIATKLRSMQDELLQSLNASTSNGYIFGGTQTETKPFTIVGGKLQYKNVDLENIATAPAGTVEKLKSDSLFLDIGLNLEFNPASSQTLDSSTAFNLSIPGINIVGSGTDTIDGNVVPNNLYDLLGAIATEFESPTYSSDKLDVLYGHFQVRSQDVMMTVSEIGSKTSYLDFMSNRMESETANMQVRQVAVESTDTAKTIIDFKSQEMAYNAALQMGAKIIQPSIFDFIR
ncbi:MAG: hypothetical protein WCF96_08060 [Eubacteriales bacterium]